jgi:hypothetical protein
MTMPIRPGHRHRYPADWPAIRKRILRRADYRCEHPGCGARQYDVGWWLRPHDGCPHEWVAGIRGLSTYALAREEAASLDWSRGTGGATPIVIVLTVARLDHTPENCADDNLRAFCQRHHLAYDCEHHARTRWATRRAAMRVGELF